MGFHKLIQGVGKVILYYNNVLIEPSLIIIGKVHLFVSGNSSV